MLGLRWGSGLCLALWSLGLRGRLYSFGARTRELRSVGLACPVACGVLVPPPEMEPTSPALQGRVLVTEPTGKSLKSLLKKV